MNHVNCMDSVQDEGLQLEVKDMSLCITGAVPKVNVCVGLKLGGQLFVVLREGAFRNSMLTHLCESDLFS